MTKFAQFIIFTNLKVGTYSPPPLYDVLKQHVLCAVYRSLIWNEAINLTQNIPDPLNFGRQEDAEE